MIVDAGFAQAERWHHGGLRRWRRFLGAMLAQALAPRIRVNAISPGLTLPSGDQSDAEFQSVAGENLLRRPVPVEEIARAVDYLLTTPAVTGHNLFLDNGQRFLKRQGDVMFSTPGRRDG